MAATAAVRGSAKLHTIMIRIATQWLAACSVLATFDLTQIPLDTETTELNAENDKPLFPWPAQVTAAMLGLFETLTLSPVLTSVDLAAQCMAQAREHFLRRLELGTHICLYSAYTCI